MVKGKEENRRKLGAEALAEAVIARALEDAFFLKIRTKSSKGIRKNGYNSVMKNDAITWLRGENDYDGLDFWCVIADIPTDRLVKKCREWFGGEHKEGYEFGTKVGLQEVLGFDIRVLKRDLRGKNSDSDDRRQDAA